MRQPAFHQLHHINSAALIDEALSGLVQPAAQVSPKFFYDALGSRLFDAITELPEYYPTRTEAAIFAQHGAAMAAAVHAACGPAPTMIDLGAGNCAKAASLFAAVQPKHYVAVDISVDFLRQALNALQSQFERIEMSGVGLDFSARLALPTGLVPGAAVVFYPGSSIGNFSPEAALRLLREAREASQGGALLIGLDLVKDVATLEAAYDDALGVTSAFNLNLLSHVNRLTGSDFSARDWQHVGLFNTTLSRIEMHLQARRDVTVRWPGGQRAFATHERIHTENSYKWRREDFAALLHRAGYTQVQTWCDEREWFAVMLAN